MVKKLEGNELLNQHEIKARSYALVEYYVHTHGNLIQDFRKKRWKKCQQVHLYEVL